MAPPRKVPKFDEVAQQGQEERKEPEESFTVIRFTVDKVSTLNEDGVESHEVVVNGYPWSAVASRDVEDGSRSGEDPDCLCIALFAINNKSSFWRIDVERFMVLVNEDPRKNITSPKMRKSFKYDDTVHELRMLAWSELIKANAGFVKDDSITVEAHIRIIKTVGLRMHKEICFTHPGDPSHNVAFVIENKKLYASREFLSIHSPVFQTMLLGPYKESGMPEIPLQDVSYTAFLELLAVLHPTGRLVTDENIYSLLELADRFQINELLEKIESFIIVSSSRTLAEKFLISEQFLLITVQDHCLRQFKTQNEVKELKNTEEYKMLSSETRAALLETMFDLMEETH